MKNFKTFKAFALILLLAFASCKKDGAVKPGADTNTSVTNTDLLDYSIIVQLNTASGLRILYFNKDGNNVKATFDAVSARRVVTLNLVNNTWTLDLNGDGSVIYTFDFAKDETGKVSIASSSYKKQDDASISMQVLLSKNSSATPVTNLHFDGNMGGVKTYVKFSADHNFAVSTKSDYQDAAWAGYYDICPGGWKGIYNGVDYMGITVKGNPTEPAQMYVQKAGDGKTYTLNLQ